MMTNRPQVQMDNTVLLQATDDRPCLIHKARSKNSQITHIYGYTYTTISITTAGGKMLHGKCPKYTTKNIRINIGPALMVVIFVSTSQSHFHLQCQQTATQGDHQFTIYLQRMIRETISGQDLKFLMVKKACTRDRFCTTHTYCGNMVYHKTSRKSELASSCQCTLKIEA